MERKWVEYFGQLHGTVLALWDAASLDEAGPNGEVTPIFINVADASLQMVWFSWFLAIMPSLTLRSDKFASRPGWWRQPFAERSQFVNRRQEPLLATF